MSKYPAAIDTEIELPKIVSNVTPVTGDVINKLRSAVVAVEAELGVKPSGIYSNVRARMNALETALATITAGSGTTFGRDLATLTSVTQKVVGLQGRDVADTTPSDGYLLTWNESLTRWEPSPVTTLQQRTVANTAPSDGFLLTWNNSLSQWEPAAPPVSFTAGGDLSGSNTSQTVIALQGYSVSNTAPDTDQLLTWTGTAWTPQDPPVSFTAGGDLSGSATSQTVEAIQGTAVSASAPSNNTFLLYNGTEWTSATISTVDIVPIFGGEDSTDLSAWTRVATISFDSSLYPATRGTLNRTIIFEAEIESTISTAVAGVRLYSITSATVLTGSSLDNSAASSRIVPYRVTATLTIGASPGEIPSSGSNIYELQTSLVSGAEGDRALVTGARLIISYQ